MDFSFCYKWRIDLLGKALCLVDWFIGDYVSSLHEMNKVSHQT